MGGELGVRVSNLLERDQRVDALLGVDIDPTALVHLGVYEPNARAGPALARSLTHEFTIGALGAAADSPSLDRIVVRSGIEIYGRARGAATRPDESVAPAPTSPYGSSLLEV